MSGEVLKPCPICGKKVSIARTENEVGERWWFITRGTYKTTRCNCRLFLESEKFTCGWNDDYSLECRAKLIDRWNTRATGGTLTAEQVREAIERHITFYEGGDYDEQAIADELNALLGSGTCEIDYFDDGLDEALDGEIISYAPPTWYLTCGHTVQGMEAPSFCQECGKRVIEAVER